MTTLHHFEREKAILSSSSNAHERLRTRFSDIKRTAMHPSPRLLASPVTARLRPGHKAPPLALLPPIPLYRRLLRTHRLKLGPEQRILGDTYLKAEFRRHKDIENPLHIVGFLMKWQEYGQKLEGDDWKGEVLDVGTVDRMSDQQIGQLHELMQAIQKRGGIVQMRSWKEGPVIEMAA